MASSRVQRGRRTEECVAAFLRDNGFPHAERIPAGLSGSDILGVVGADIEVKARADFDPGAWLRQAETRSPDDLSVCVVRLKGQGEDAGRYLAFVRLAELVHLMRDAGMGSPRPDAPQDALCGDLSDFQGAGVSVGELAQEIADRILEGIRSNPRGVA